MPTDFGEITAYHREEAARHYAMAHAARERRSFGEAEYEVNLAARWDEAAREQKTEMRQEPARHIPYRRSNYRPPEPPMPQRVSFAAAFLSAIKRMAHAIRQFLPRRSSRIESLSLR
jgi:hypothetical protein